MAALSLAAPSSAQHVVGVVVDSLSGEPVPAVRVSLNGADPVLTDREGRFRISEVHWRSEKNVLECRRIGYSQSSRPVHPIEDASEVTVRIALVRIAVQMEEVVVDGVRMTVPTKLAGFYWRRENAPGEFLTEEDIEHIRAVNIVDVLQVIPGLDVAGPIRTFRSGGICRMTSVYFDGILIDIARLVDVPPEEIAAIEFYSGPARVPLQFNRTGSMCGALVVWTK